jgi:hypothetical protein
LVNYAIEGKLMKGKEMESNWRNFGQDEN